MDKSYFHSSGYIQNSIIKVNSGFELNMKELPPFLRTLMVMDGTVTKSLSAWFWEPVKVSSLLNDVKKLLQPVDGLDVAIGSKVLYREVALVGANSDKIFAYARSIVSLDYLPIEIGKLLEKGEMGIGELLREQDIETYREIYNIDYMKKNQCDDSLLLGLSSDVVSRSYRIRVNAQPSIVVTEYFPIELYNYS